MAHVSVPISDGITNKNLVSFNFNAPSKLPDLNLSSVNTANSMKSGLSEYEKEVIALQREANSIAQQSAFMQYQANAQANQYNMQMNRENIAFQQAENKIAREREDNAVQRRVADLHSAGLSATLAAGSASSAQAMTAPRNSFEYQSNLKGIDIASIYAGILQSVALAKKYQSETALNNISAETLAKSNENKLLLQEKEIESASLKNEFQALTNKRTEAVLSAEIEKAFADLDLSKWNVENAGQNFLKLRAEIVGQLKQNEKISREAELVAYDIVYRDLQSELERLKIKYAGQENTRAWINSISTAVKDVSIATKNFSSVGGKKK